ncbi:MAG: phosphatidate cytidylyltransferase [bacterium]|nr:phosphatidate cytidylyltransferase [bacterium]
MPLAWVRLMPLLLLTLLGLLLAAARLSRGRFVLPGYLGYLWAFLVVFAIADHISFTPAVWLMALISFRALREYFSLVDLRLEDRWGMIGAYLSIPFMILLIQIDWYGFFIVSIPVYAFIVIPFLVALGDREGRGSLLSIGAIDFGLFFFVYCLGHIAYLALFSTWLTLLLLLGVVVCNVAISLTARLGRIPGFLLATAATVGLSLLLRPWTTVPFGPSIFVGVLIPVLVHMGEYTVGVLERDLGISSDDLEPGRGHVLDSMKSYLFAAPIVFHYLRWVMKFGELLLGHGN